VGGYGLGRLWVESLRSDNASLLLGLRVNTWMSLALIAGSIITLVVRGLRPRPDDPVDPYREPRESLGTESTEPTEPTEPAEPSDA
jgi:prolipoprotein diacylglyceryltransferase